MRHEIHTGNLHSLKWGTQKIYLSNCVTFLWIQIIFSVKILALCRPVWIRPYKHSWARDVTWQRIYAKCLVRLQAVHLELKVYWTTAAQRNHISGALNKKTEKHDMRVLVAHKKKKHWNISTFVTFTKSRCMTYKMKFFKWKI